MTEQLTPPTPVWVSVEERLPEECDIYPVFVESNIGTEQQRAQVQFYICWDKFLNIWTHRDGKPINPQTRITHWLDFQYP